MMKNMRTGTTPMARARATHPLTRGLLALLLATPLAALAGPKITHWSLDTGAQVYYVESRALPMIDIQIDFAVGSAHEPVNKAGLASLTRSLLDIGAEGLDEQAISERIADSGAQFGGGSDADRSSLTIRTLSSPPERDAAVTLAATLLAKPTFPAEAFERERGRAIAALRESLTRPATLAERSFTASIYGNHPYGMIASPESLERINRDDLVRFHRMRYTAGAATITLVGDLSRDEADTIARALTQALPRGGAPAAIPAPIQPQRNTTRVPHPSAQAHIIAGMPGISRNDPDYYPLLVGNYVLGGGGFVSRLTREVREKRGFAYSVFSSFEPRLVPGPFEIGLQTRGSQAQAALDVVEEVLAGFIASGPTDEELQAARDNIVNGFGLRLDSNRKILDHVAMIGFYRLPPDWLDAYPGQIEKVTAEQIRDAFARRIKAEHLVTVIAGGDGDAQGDASVTSSAPN